MIHSNTAIPNNYKEELFSLFASNLKQRVSSILFEDQVATLLEISKITPAFQERFEKVGIADMVLAQIAEFFSQDEETSKKTIQNYLHLTDLYKFILRGKENRINQSLIEFQIQNEMIRQIFSHDYRRLTNLQLLNFIFTEEVKTTQQITTLKSMIHAIQDNFWKDIESTDLVCQIILENITGEENSLFSNIVLSQFDFFSTLFEMLGKSCSLHDSDKSNELLLTRGKYLINLLISISHTSQRARHLFEKKKYGWHHIFKIASGLYYKLSETNQGFWLEYLQSLYLFNDTKQIRNKEALKYYIRNFMDHSQLSIDSEVVSLMKLSPENLAVVAELGVLDGIFRNCSNDSEKIMNKEWLLDFSLECLSKHPTTEILRFITASMNTLTTELDQNPEQSGTCRRILTKILSRLKELVSYELPSIRLTDKSKGIFIPHIFSCKDSSLQKTQSQITLMV